jgi:molybdopterin converting factor small subunit
MSALSKEKIEQIKRERNAKKRMMKDRAVYVISLMALPSILLMVASLIFSARTLQDSQLAVISGLVSSVTVGLITLLQRATGTEQEKEDPMVVLAKELVSHLTDNQGQTEIIMDKNRVIVNGRDQQIITKPDTELIKKVVKGE